MKNIEIVIGIIGVILTAISIVVAVYVPEIRNFINRLKNKKTHKTVIKNKPAKKGVVGVLGVLGVILTVISIVVAVYVQEVRSALGIGKEDTNEGIKEKDDHKFGEFVDERDNKLYKWVRLGSQIWMAENLAYEPPAKCGFGYWDIGPNDNLTKKLFCVYERSDSFLEQYGILYTWEALNSNTNQTDGCDICPEGWHVPSDKEWKQLELFVGMNPSNVDKLKYRGVDEAKGLKSSSDWSRNGNGTNSLRFNALPGGYRHFEDGRFYNRNNYVLYWTSTELSDESAYFRSFRYEDNKINSYYDDKRNAFYVRCIKNQ